MKARATVGEEEGAAVRQSARRGYDNRWWQRICRHLTVNKKRVEAQLHAGEEQRRYCVTADVTIGKEPLAVGSTGWGDFLLLAAHSAGSHERLMEEKATGSKRWNGRGGSIAAAEAAKWVAAVSETGNDCYSWVDDDLERVEDGATEAVEKEEEEDSDDKQGQQEVEAALLCTAEEACGRRGCSNGRAEAIWPRVGSRGNSTSKGREEDDGRRLGIKAARERSSISTTIEAGERPPMERKEMNLSTMCNGKAVQKSMPVAAKLSCADEVEGRDGCGSDATMKEERRDLQKKEINREKGQDTPWERPVVPSGQHNTIEERDDREDSRPGCWTSKDYHWYRKRASTVDSIMSGTYLLLERDTYTDEERVAFEA
ncbi:hypothetical protein B296_00029556 [Ensete ventricosum]|uniref:Uncharacterized protein n=1 Tax=Ensete ventricosum TaxID=4639 RepID=A0A426XCY9_ENSVE|nr:hypothetical protein B296_00029556 [Ensete ventricosum]